MSKSLKNLNAFRFCGERRTSKFEKLSVWGSKPRAEAGEAQSLKKKTSEPWTSLVFHSMRLMMPTDDLWGKSSLLLPIFFCFELKWPIIISFFFLKCLRSAHVHKIIKNVSQSKNYMNFGFSNLIFTLCCKQKIELKLISEGNFNYWSDRKLFYDLKNRFMKVLSSNIKVMTRLPGLNSRWRSLSLDE